MPSTAVEVYDVASGAWSTRAPVPTQRSHAGAAAVRGRVYVVGGCLQNDCSIGTTNRVEAYDPRTNTWSPQAPMPTVRPFPALSAIGSRLYAAGGDGSRTLEVYDPVTDVWTAKASMPVACRGSSVGIHGKLYVACEGGKLEIYDPVSDRWTRKGLLPGARSYGVGEANGILYAVSDTDRSVRAYDPNMDAWSPVAEIPTPRAGSRPQGIDGVLYVAGNGATATSALEAFFP